METEEVGSEMTVVQRIEAAYKRLEKAKEIVRAGKVHRIEGADGVDGEGLERTH